MAKIVFTDLDGTIVHNKAISPKTIETADKLRDKGIRFTIATGRHHTAVGDFVEALRLTDPVICGNGAYIFDPLSDEILHVNYINGPDAKEVIKKVNSVGVDFLLYTKDYIWGTEGPASRVSKSMGPHIKVMEYNAKTMHSLPINEIFKVLIMEDDEDKMNLVIKSLKGAEGVQLVQSRRNFLDIGAIGVDKGSAIKVVCDLLEIKVEDSIAFGDEDNDLTMLETAGIGVAMDNGTESAKKIANKITLSVEEDGFSHFIEKYIL